MSSLDVSFNNKMIYGCVIEAKDYCRHRYGQPFEFEEYKEKPELYESTFSRDLAPHATAIVNGIYWEPKYPRILTRQDAERLANNPQSKLVSIADISCDINGSIEITHKASKIEDPFFYFGSKLQIMSIDNLPAQLPRDSTEYFGSRLVPIITKMVQDQKEVIDRATILRTGRLQGRHSWLNSIVAQAKKKRALILGSGYVSGPVLKHLGANNAFELCIGSNNHKEAKIAASWAKGGARIEDLNAKDRESLAKLVDSVDVVISLIPATMHLPVAQECLDKGKHLVTASYISQEMQELDKQYAYRLVMFIL